MFTRKVNILIIALIVGLLPSFLQAQTFINPDLLIQRYSQHKNTLTKSPLLLFREEKSEIKNYHSFFNFIDRKLNAAAFLKNHEKDLLRQAWREWLGIDIYYTYFKAKEAEEWVSDKAKVTIFKIHGRPKIENNKFNYTFSIKF
ncbi:MAG: flagellar biosynthetic protein FliQ [Candidatus Omnitrophota bacterium]|jgi:hypothetical protein